jgi:hypothetical protein
MAVRVTVTEVKEIMDNISLSSAVVNAYITSANTLVNSALGTGSTDKLKEVERWLAAHMIACTRERMAVKEEAGGTKIEYTGKYGEALSSTPYGQMVLLLDTTGFMASLAFRPVRIMAVTSFK